jgi:hypothetical protein
MNHVRIGKTTKPVLDPINLAVQTEPVSSEIILQAYQKEILVGIPRIIAEAKGLSLHQTNIF